MPKIPRAFRNPPELDTALQREATAGLRPAIADSCLVSLVFPLRPSRLPGILSLASVLLASQFALAEELSVTIQRLAPPKPASTMMVPNRVPVAEPPRVTPAARLPQYQLHRTDIGGDPNSAGVRLLLALPGRPLLIETQMTIDGQPFGQSREARIQKLQAVIANPVLATPPVEPPPAEIPPAETAQPAAEAAATPPDAKPNDLKPEEAAEPEEAEKTAPAEVPAVPNYRSPATRDERVLRYVASTGTKPSAQELRWLLATWVDGPVLLFLHENFQRFRAAQQPLFYVLDINRDHVLSAEEVASAVKSLEECDLDRNEIVESTEIAKVAADPRNQGRVVRSAHPLLLRLDRAEELSGIVPRLLSFYGADRSADALATIDADKDGTISDSERQDLTQRRADLVLKYDFYTPVADQSRLTVISSAEEWRGVMTSATREGNVIRLTFEQFVLELSAVQGPPSDQVSLGAVNDGYAMLPELDSNGDGRFTIRERRTFVDQLRAFDRSGDGTISMDEIAPTYRFCVALGPHVHESLGTLRRMSSTPVVASTGPDWFAEMDKNRDFDLSRGEFPGTEEQFQKLDLDSDQLISSEEASQSTD